MRLFVSCFLASLGFAIIFNIPKNKALVAGLVGGMGGLCYGLITTIGISNISAMLITSIFFSTLSEILARVLKCPSTMFSICALIPFVPGSKIYLSMVEIINRNLNLALEYGLSTIFEASALVIGMMITASIFKAIKKAPTKQHDA